MGNLHRSTSLCVAQYASALSHNVFWLHFTYKKSGQSFCHGLFAGLVAVGRPVISVGFDDPVQVFFDMPVTACTALTSDPAMVELNVFFAAFGNVAVDSCIFHPADLV